MGTIIRLVLIGGVVWLGYQFAGDQIKEKVIELQARTYEIVNPEGKRADLLEDLNTKVRDIGEIRKKLNEIDVDKIEDAEIKTIIKEIKESASANTVEEITKIVNDIEKLNEKDNPITESIIKIIERIIPINLPTPTPTIQEPDYSQPTPSSQPPALHCEWVCE